MPRARLRRDRWRPPPLRLWKLRHHLTALDLVDRIEQSVYRPSETKTLSRKPSTVSPSIGTGISDSWLMAAPISADSAVGNSTTSTTKALQLSALPESSSAETSARAESSEAERSRRMSAMVSGSKHRTRRRCTEGSGRAAPTAGSHSRAAPPFRRPARG